MTTHLLLTMKRLLAKMIKRSIELTKAAATPEDGRAAMERLIQTRIPNF
jgi:hypothetical protein